MRGGVFRSGIHSDLRVCAEVDLFARFGAVHLMREETAVEQKRQLRILAAGVFPSEVIIVGQEIKPVALLAQKTQIIKPRRRNTSVEQVPRMHDG